MLKICLSFFILVFLAGCAAPSAPKPFSNAQNVVGTYDQVWDGVMDVLSQNNVQIKTLAKDSGFISAESARFTDNFAVCDERLVHNVRKYSTFNIRLQRGDQVQKMTVNSDWRLVGRNTITGYPEERECRSTGLLEGYLMQRAAVGLPVTLAPSAQYLQANAATANASGFATVNDVDKVPASDNCKRLYQEQFLSRPYPRAVALSAVRKNGSRYCTYRSGNAQAVESALESCSSAAVKEGLSACKLYAVNDRVVWQAD
jgi:hypothetical protein